MILSTLQSFVTNLRQSFPSTIAKQPKNSDLLNQCEIRSLFIAINLTTDPTSKVEEVLTGISSRDLFSFGSLEQSLVGSIDFTYRNVWNEIRTLHFEGQNAILLALKVLSNKIYRGVNRPDSIQVYCYSERYRQDLRQLVMGLVNRCVSIQVGDIQQPCQTSRLRVAGKNWQLFLKIAASAYKKSEMNRSVMTLKVRWILTKFYKHQLKMARQTKKVVAIHQKWMPSPVKDSYNSF